MLKVFLTDLRFTKLVFEILLMQLDGFPMSKEDDSSSYKHHQAPTSSTKLQQARSKGSASVLTSLEEKNLFSHVRERTFDMHDPCKVHLDIPPRLANFLGEAGSWCYYRSHD
jgi:hypothetical protein